MELNISESLFNRLAKFLYSKGALSQTKLVASVPAKTLFKTLLFFRQPLGLMKTLYIEVKLTEVPSVSITKDDGITVNARAKVRVFTMKANNKIRAVKKQRNVLSVSATLKVAMEVAITGQSLTCLSHEVLCTIVTKNTLRDALTSVLNGFLTSKIKNKIKKMQIPLPKLVDFTHGKIDYCDGFMTFRGNLDVTDAGVEKVHERLGKVLKRV